jgi:histone H3/H4
MAENALIPKVSFARLVREIAKEIKDGIDIHFAKESRWERDALFALQNMAEHILVMVFEMM